MKSIKVVVLTMAVFFAGVSLGESTVDLGKLVVTASRMAQHDYKVAGNVTVITQEDIEASNAQNIADLLKESLGVHVYDNGSLKTTVLDIRGFGDTAARNVLVLINDRKVNNIDVSGPDLSQVPLEAVERIEIIRGAGSVLYGDNAVGGVVNIITKKGKGPFSGEVGAAYGSYQTSQTDVEASGSKLFDIAGLDNEVSYYVYSQYSDTDGYRTNSNFLAKDLNTRVGYKVSDKVTLDLNTGWHEDDQGLPGGLTTAEIDQLGRRASADPEDFASTKDRFVQLTTDIDPWPNDLELGNLVLDLSYRNRDVYDAFYSFGETATKRSIDSKGVGTKYLFDHEILDREVSVVVGTDYYEHENDILGKGSNVDDLTISKDEFGIYGFLEGEVIENVFLNGGHRIHNARYQFTQRNVTVDQSSKVDGDVSMGGARYEYAKGSNLHFNVQQTFRLLATDEWYNSANFPSFGITPGLNTDLSNQTGIQYEAGVKHNFNDTVVVSLTPYLLNLKNEIFFDPTTFSNSNYPKTRRIGIEFGQNTDIKKFVTLEALDKLEFFTNFTYQIPQFKDGANDGRDIPFVPRYQASYGLLTGFFKHYRLSMMSRYVGSRFAINDTLNTTPKAKPYFVLDSKLSFLKDPFEFYLAVNNILGEQYYTYVAKSAFSNNKDYFPAPERNFLVGLDFKF